MDTNIRILASGAADVVRGAMNGTDDDIPILQIGSVEVIFYDFRLAESDQAAWLRNLAAEAESLAQMIEALAAHKAVAS